VLPITDEILYFVLATTYLAAICIHNLKFSAHLYQYVVYNTVQTVTPRALLVDTNNVTIGLAVDNTENSISSGIEILVKNILRIEKLL
jgi:hypothetical protein